MQRDHELSIRFFPEQDGTYEVVLESGAGSVRSVFQSPFEAEELPEVLESVERVLTDPLVVQARDVTRISLGPLLDPKEMGRNLFEALFDEEARSLLEKSRARAQSEDEPLMLKLGIDPSQPELAPVARLPWELLCAEEAGGFLSLDPGVSMVRFLDIGERPLPLPTQHPLRVLVLISNPSDVAPLDLDAERARIRESWGQCEGVEVEFLEDATLARLAASLGNAEYGAFHFMGHGDFDEDSGEGVLLLETEDGLREPVTGAKLGALMGDEPTLQLAFLNACNTGQSDADGDQDMFKGVATAMVGAGVPAVLAMQFPVSDGAAIAFSEAFYHLVAREHPVDVAVAGGRHALHEAHPRSQEWGTPVLFMRSPDGVLFNFTSLYGFGGSCSG